MENRIRSIQELLTFFKNIKRSLFYVGTFFGTTLLNINGFMPSFEIISCYDPFLGAYPFIKVPSSLKADHRCQSITHCPLELMKMTEVITYMKSKDPKPCIIAVIITKQIQKVCKENDIQFWGVSAELFQLLGNKVKILDILKSISIPYIPNVCSKIKSYEGLLETTKDFGTSSLVIQDQFGQSGNSTFFVSSEQDYNNHHIRLESGRQFKIMPFKRLKCFAIGGVTLQSGTIMGPLQSELIGHEQLTRYQGGYCGNEIRQSYFQNRQVELKVREQLMKYSLKFAKFIQTEFGFRGTFGIDYSVDLDTNQIYFMEVNPRLTGSTSLSFQYYSVQNRHFPIFLFHCLEFLGGHLDMKIDALNQEWIGLSNYHYQISHIALKGMNADEIALPITFSAGIWKIENDRPIFTGKTSFLVDQMEDDEIFFIPNKGFAKANIIMKRRCQDYDFKLTEESKKLIDKFIKIRLEQKKN